MFPEINAPKISSHDSLNCLHSKIPLFFLEDKRMLISEQLMHLTPKSEREKGAIDRYREVVACVNARVFVGHHCNSDILLVIRCRFY